jgi:putative selenate reductase
MGKIMKFTPLSALLRRASGEYRAQRSIYGIPESVFRKAFALEEDSPGLAVMSGKASIPIGPAAGPHSQIAPNLLAAYLSGARVFELKTVQQNDRLDIEKPCIEALDEGYNVEWSTELSLEEARREYLNGWIAINLFGSLMSRKPAEFFFNMSVGYTLDGIRSQKMDAFIEGMRRPESTGYWDDALEELDTFIRDEAFARAFGDEALERARPMASHMPVRPVHSVTLSTMHGCPPAEIAKIGLYLIEEKGFDTYIKLNPTLLGYGEAHSILTGLGWDEVLLKRESFEHDLQFVDALSLVRSLGEAAATKGRRFGIKLSNTLASINDGRLLPGTEKYMSGRALYPLTVNLAARLADALDDMPMRFSYCGGVSALNAGKLIGAGLGPLTVATDILKPGGYLRLSHIASEAVEALHSAPLASDPAALAALAEEALVSGEYCKDWKKGKTSIRGPLPMYDCFAAPCVEACPVQQKVPAYLALQGEGRSAQALATVMSDNPLPTITGILCDHVCQEHCSRLDYEGPVLIREVKARVAASAELHPKPLAASVVKAASAPGSSRPGEKTAVIGAGPAGLSCAFHLALAGHEVTVFDASESPGGVVANTIPSFRISREDLARDIDRIAAMGVNFEFGKTVDSLEALKAQGFDSFFLGIGAEAERNLPLELHDVEKPGQKSKTPMPRSIHALEFLETFAREGPLAFKGYRHILVAGGGNTACDALRVATRLPDAASARISYRRTKREMPADREELEAALAEASKLEASPGSRKTDGLFGAADSPALLELSLPEYLKPGKAGLRIMSLGEIDTSGRRAPSPTDRCIEVPCDLLIAAVGEEPDRNFLERMGVDFGHDRRPSVDPVTMETTREGLYLGGDARRGSSSIIAAEADGRAAARSILLKEGKLLPDPDYRPAAVNVEKLAARGTLLPSLSPEDPGFAAREADRCLACDSACLRCVEVCPNRANVFIPTGLPFRQEAQILHLDRACNECGNCGFFCPWDGDPCKEKPTLFDGKNELEEAKNPGFAFLDGEGLPRLLLRGTVGGEALEFDYAAWNGCSSPPEYSRIIALAREVYRHHSYLLEEGR